MSKKYSISDLQIIDTLEHVRSCPQLYFETGSPSVLGIVRRLVTDIFLTNSCSTFVKSSGNWWVVASDKDWWGARSAKIDMPIFPSVEPFPLGGKYGIRAELLIHAYSESIFVFDSQSATKILDFGDNLICPFEHETLSKEFRFERAIVFRLSKKVPLYDGFFDEKDNTTGCEWPVSAANGGHSIQKKSKPIRKKK